MDNVSKSILAMRYFSDAIKVLEEIMRDESAAAKDRVDAASTLLKIACEVYLELEKNPE